MICEGCQSPTATQRKFGAKQIALCTICFRKPRGQAPYGYRRVEGGFQIDLEEQAIRERIVRLSILGLSTRGIAGQLNHEQVPHRGAYWHANTVGRIVRAAREHGPRDLLRQLGACQEALAWIDTQEDIETAWSRCMRADWLGWWIYLVEGWRTIAELVLEVLPDACPQTKQSLADCLQTNVPTLQYDHPALAGLVDLARPAPSKELCQVLTWLDAVLSYPALVELTRMASIPVLPLCKGELAARLKQYYPNPPRMG